MTLVVTVAISVLAGCTSPQYYKADPVANTVVSENAVNINSATAAELEALPGIGQTLAKRIIEYRDKYGRFRRPEHLMLVPGVSERRFRQIRSQIRSD